MNPFLSNTLKHFFTRRGLGIIVFLMYSLFGFSFSAKAQSPLFFEADFLEFTLSKDTLYTWGYSSEDIFADTAFVDIDLGGTVQGQTFVLDTVVSAQFKVYQQHKNSVTLMNETVNSS